MVGFKILLKYGGLLAVSIFLVRFIFINFDGVVRFFLNNFFPDVVGFAGFVYGGIIFLVFSVVVFCVLFYFLKRVGWL